MPTRPDRSPFRRRQRTPVCQRSVGYPIWSVRNSRAPPPRSNVCPEIDPPTTPSFYAFSYTVPSESRAARSFVAAGSGEAREGGPSYEGRIIRPGDHSPKAMREKANFVLGAMEQRMTALGFSWADVTATQVYTIFEIHPLLADEFVRRGAMSGGLVWHFARPPVQGLAASRHSPDRYRAVRPRLSESATPRAIEASALYFAHTVQRRLGEDSK